MLLPSRLLSYSKIAKVECNDKIKNRRFLNFDISNPPPVLLKDIEKQSTPTNHINLVPPNLSLPTSILYHSNNIIKFVQQQSSKTLFFLSKTPLSLIPIDRPRFRSLINAILFFPNDPNIPHFQIITTFRFSRLSFPLYPKK